MRRLLGGVAALLLLAAGCAPGAELDASGGKSQVKVDTPELRQLKQEIGVETCAPGPATDGGLPDLTLRCLGGGPDVDLASLQGPLILNFWYASCGPCQHEMPALQEFHDRYGDQVPIIGITNDLYPEYALELTRDTGARYPQLADPGNDLQSTDLRPRVGYPAFAFLSADGTVQMTAGGIESADELVDLVQTNLGITL